MCSDRTDDAREVNRRAGIIRQRLAANEAIPKYKSAKGLGGEMVVVQEKGRNYTCCGG